MYLDCRPTRYKNKTYKSYSIVKSYREAGKVKKEILWPLGRLSDEEVAQIRLICKARSQEGIVITELKNILPQRSRPYLDIAIVNQLWKEWKLSNAFTLNLTKGDLPTPLVAQVLTINRCLYPCSHYSIPQWIKKTAISEVLGVSLEGLDEDKIYYELDKIENNKECLEDHLFKTTYARDPKSYNYVNFDLTTSYFVGIRCKLSDFGLSKDSRPHHKQVVLAVMVNEAGYPFKWDVLPGNTAEVETLESEVKACVLRFKLKNVSLVFDRGIVSEENLEYVDSNQLKFITTLDKDQIPNIPDIALTIFKDLTPERVEEGKYSLPGFSTYDERLSFKDLGIGADRRRYILGFNPDLFLEERRSRENKIRDFLEFVQSKNQELRVAKRSRNYRATKKKFDDELKRLKIKSCFKELELKKLQVMRSNKNGRRVKVRTFEAVVTKDDDKIAKASLLDGLCVFITNHVEEKGGEFLLVAERIIAAYRNKNKIEEAFKHIKSFLKIRPFHVNTDTHVRAVYTLCILAYLINKDFAERRKRIEGKDFLNSKELYEPFRSCHLVKIKDSLSGESKEEPVELTKEQKESLKNLGLGRLIG